MTLYVTFETANVNCKRGEATTEREVIRKKSVDFKTIWRKARMGKGR